MMGNAARPWIFAPLSPHAHTRRLCLTQNVIKTNKSTASPGGKSAYFNVKNIFQIAARQRSAPWFSPFLVLAIDNSIQPALRLAH